MYSNTLIRMDAGNKNLVFEQLSALQFSLFPLYVIKDTETALLISKSTDASPDLGDLHESDFYKHTKRFLSGSPRIKLFNIGQSLSPYLKTLVEYRVFDYEQGNPALLQELLQKSVFAISREDSNHVVVHNAAFMITASAGVMPSQAPDHLMRLFSYNHIMQQAGKKLLDSVPEENELVTEAKTAVIVTPVSSMVVLESQEDYDRFKIAQNNNSLGNASLKSKGSVPEPHEWLLISLALSVLAYIRFRPALKTVNN